MMIHSLRPALGSRNGSYRRLTVLFFGNRMKPNVRESITMAASVIMAGIVFSMVPAVLSGDVYISRLWTIAGGIDLTLKTDGAGMVFACIASSL